MLGMLHTLVLPLSHTPLDLSFSGPFLQLVSLNLMDCEGANLQRDDITTPFLTKLTALRDLAFPNCNLSQVSHPARSRTAAAATSLLSRLAGFCPTPGCSSQVP